LRLCAFAGKKALPTPEAGNVYSFLSNIGIQEFYPLVLI
jgi:hypothetical protein